MTSWQKSYQLLLRCHLCSFALAVKNRTLRVPSHTSFYISFRQTDTLQKYLVIGIFNIAPNAVDGDFTGPKLAPRAAKLKLNAISNVHVQSVPRKG